MNIDLSYESGLVVVFSDMNKMKMMKTCIKELPDKIISKEVKKQIIETANTGDTVLFASIFHDQEEEQKRILVSILKALNISNTIDELRRTMKPVVNKDGCD